MAEGGGEGDESNPFSFKSYVKKKTKKSDEEDMNPEDIFAVTSVPSRKKEKQSLVVDDDSTSKSKKKNKENPFSFKKFLGQSEQRLNDRVHQRPPVPSELRGDSVTSPPSHLGQSASVPTFGQQPGIAQHAGGPPDLASHLPDFIQNHFDGPKLNEDDGRLPDFTSHNRPSPADRVGSSLPLLGSGNEENEDTTFSDEEEDEEGAAGRSQSLSLPDFLVDSAIPGAQGVNQDAASAKPANARSRSRLPEWPPVDDDASGELQREGASAVFDDTRLDVLQDETIRLRATMAEMEQKSRDEDKRVAELEKEIRRLRKKEAEETEVMEKAVQQVEENLVSTTTRAVQAETMAAKLKQEVKALSTQVKSLTLENETLKSGDKGLADIRERTKYTAEQLAGAAIAAEKNLKGLMEGVDKLKLLGLVLSSLEKISEDDDGKSSQGGSTKSSPT